MIRLEGCCCSHGTRCTCALKKEQHLDPVPESDSDEASSTSASLKPGRPRASTTQSDGNVTTASNGHHKPIHKHNNMAHKCGLPYVVPRAHSIHGPSPSGLANRSVDNLPHISTIDALHSESQMKDSMFSAQQEQRLVKSEHGSPVLSGSSDFEQLNGFLPPLDLSNLSTDYNFVPNLDGSMADHEPPLFSAGLSAASVDWSHYDGLEFHNDSFTSSYSQPPSWFDFNSVDQPGLTSNSTSGDLSEVDDFGAMGDVPPIPRSMASNPELVTEAGVYQPTTSSYSSVQLPALADDDLQAVDMEQFLKNANLSAPVVTNDGLPAHLSSNETKESPGASDLGVLGSDGDNDASWMNDFMLNETAVNEASSPESPDPWAQ